VVGGAGWVICLEQGADLHTAQLMPLPLTVSCFSKIQIGFTFWYWPTCRRCTGVEQSAISCPSYSVISRFPTTAQDISVPALLT